MINLDLSSIVKKGTKAPAQVQILGVVIQKVDHSEETEKALKDAGVDVTMKVEGDETIVYKQEDVDLETEEGIVPIKLDSDFVLVCKGFNPDSMFGNNQVLGNVLKEHGFVPGFSLATEAMYTAVRNSYANPADTKDMVSKLDSAISQFKEYSINLVNTIPPSAFAAMEAFQAAKFDKAEAVRKAEEEEVAKKAEEKAAADAAEAERVAKEEADKKSVEAAAAGAAEEKDKSPAAVDASAISEMVSTALKNATEGLMKQIGTVTAAISTMQKGIGDLTTKVEAAAKDAAEAKTVAQKTDATVRGSVVGGEPGDDDEPVARTASQSDGIGNIDTAYHRNVRKTEKARFQRGAGSRGHLL